MLSALDIFKIGLGPSSSHTVGPMRIGKRFIEFAQSRGMVSHIERITIDLHGSLASTGVGHGTDKASLLGLMGMQPDQADPDEAERAFQQTRTDGKLILAGGHEICFDMAEDLRLRPQITPEIHPNEMRIAAYDADGIILADQTWYSVGGGFIATARQLSAPAKDDLIDLPTTVPHQFMSASELLAICADQGLSIEQLILVNEDSFRDRQATLTGLDLVWQTMSQCIDRGLENVGVLPGGLGLSRRAAKLYQALAGKTSHAEHESLFDWLNVYAMAVNEENAAGGRVVTAPTNGAAGIIPAVIKRYCVSATAVDTNAVRRFLLTAAGIGILYKQRASISGAEMGCQGEVGVACSMAAAGLAAVWGGSNEQIERAAEIGMEHNLGLTCDPVGGLVQIPCIERNAMGAVKAVNAARLALTAADSHKVKLDQVIETMRQTGLDMSRKYKETSEGGLAVNVIEC